MAAKATKATKAKAKATKAKPAPALIAGVRVTNPDRVVYQLDGHALTKGDVARYIERVAPLMLPHVSGRPISVVRCHAGSAGPGFFQKHVIPGMPEQVHSLDVVERKGTFPNLTVHDAAGLVGLVQMSALEFHTWSSAQDDTERPDRVIVDLDPGADLPWSRVVEAARRVRAILAGDGLETFVKTTGGKGLHVIAPLEKATWHDVATYGHHVAAAMEQQESDKYTTNMKKVLRAGKIFLDVGRNMRGSTTIAPWSMRKSGGVAVPVAWDELDDVRGATWTLVNVEPRLRAHAMNDPWRRFFEVRQRLPR